MGVLSTNITISERLTFADQFFMWLFKTPNPLMMETAMSRKRFRQERRFFVQAFLSSGIIMIIFLAFHLVKKSMALRLVHFLTGCVCVILVHGSNALVLLLFNKELRNTILMPIKRFLPFTVHMHKCKRSSVLETLSDRKPSPPTSATDA